MTTQRDVFLYEQLANDLAKALYQGEYGIYERLPSLRYVSEQYQVSMATVIQAYQLLEQKGLIEAKSKSGYYVCPRIEETYQAPTVSQPKSVPSEVNVAHLAMSLINESRQPGLTKLGAAIPEPDLLPLGSLSRTLAGIARRNTLAAASYEQAQGNLKLRQQIVHLMREAGVRCNAKDIIITNGCLEALGLALRAVAQKGDTIAVESPTYFGILQVIESLGMKVVEIPTHANTGIDPGGLEQAIKKYNVAACMLIPTFSNPMGATMPDENKQKVVSLLNAYGVPLIEDDVYGVLSYEPRRPKAAKAYDNIGNVIYCSSFSKTVSPGLRIGWIVAGKYQEQVLYQKFLDNISTAIHPQLALAEFLSKGSYRRSIRHSARVYLYRIEQFKRWISETFPQKTRITNPIGGFLLWIELPTQIDSMELYRKAMAKKIAITPGILFSAQGQYKNHIRLSCGAVDGERARKSISTLAMLLNEIS